VDDLQKEVNNIKNNPFLVRYKKAQDRYVTEVMEEELLYPWAKGALGSL